MDTLASIFVPIKNAEKFIKTSINILLDKSFTDFENRVINDGSKINSQSIIESTEDKRNKFFQSEKKGISPALSLALSHAIERLCSYKRKTDGVGSLQFGVVPAASELDDEPSDSDDGIIGYMISK